MLLCHVCVWKCGPAYDLKLDHIPEMLDDFFAPRELMRPAGGPIEVDVPDLQIVEETTKTLAESPPSIATVG
eukprot:178303-Amorphochlora_amoeboformis.AAC.1